MNSTTTNAKPVRAIAALLIAAGALMIITGGAASLVVRAQLVAENITVPVDAFAFGGKQVDGPLDALVQADVISAHLEEISDGSTYAELAQDDPTRAVVLEGSMLRASLFTSVMAFGIAALIAGLGLLQILIGTALRTLVPATDEAPLIRVPVAA